MRSAPGPSWAASACWNFFRALTMSASRAFAWYSSSSSPKRRLVEFTRRSTCSSMSRSAPRDRRTAPTIAGRTQASTSATSLNLTVLIVGDCPRGERRSQMRSWITPAVPPPWSCEQRREVAARCGRRLARDLLRRALRDNRPPRAPPSGPRSITQSAHLMTSRLCSMTTHGVAGVDEPREHAEQLLDVVEVQARGRLVEDVERAPRLHLAELAAELDPLRLAAAQRRRRLADLHVAEPDLDAASPRMRASCGKAAKSSRHSSTLDSSTSCDALALEPHLERLRRCSACRRTPRRGRTRRRGSASRP